jgi:hypothetical protein
LVTVPEIVPRYAPLTYVTGPKLIFAVSNPHPRVGVGVIVLVGVYVFDGVIVSVGVFVSVGVGVSVGVFVLVLVGVLVIVGVLEGVQVAQPIGAATLMVLLVRKFSTIPSRMVVRCTYGQAVMRKGVMSGWLKSTPMATRSPGPPGSSPDGERTFQ